MLKLLDMSFLIVIMREAWLYFVSVLIEYVYVITFLVRYVSWSGLWPDLPVSARMTRTGAGTRELMQGMIQNKTCSNECITYLQQKAVTYMHIYLY